MRVEITEKRLNDQDQKTGQQYTLVEGDIVTVSDDTGKRWLSHGWAKDVDGKHPTGERKVEGAAIVAPEKAKQSTRARGT